MTEFIDLLNSYRAGELDRAAFVEQLTAAGVDASDAELLADNKDFTPPGDMAQQHIDAQARRRKTQQSRI